MIILTEKDGLFYTHSDAGVYIHGGDPEGDYTDAVDTIQYTYVETDKPLPETSESEYSEAGRILLGEGVSGE